MKYSSLLTLCLSLTSSFALASTQTYHRMAVATVKTSGEQSPNIAGNTLDSDFDTRWSAKGDGKWIQFEMGAYSSWVDRIGISWYQGDQRKSKIQILGSDDAKNWDLLFEGESSGKSTKLEWFGVGSSYEYFRIVGFGNNKSEWNSITEVVFDGEDGRDFDGFDGYVDVLDASSHDGNLPRYSRDYELKTRWSAKGKGETISFGTYDTELYECAAIAWYKGNERKAKFSLSNGSEKKSFTSNGKTLLPEIYHTGFSKEKKYIKIIGNGNSENDWNSITEVYFPSVSCKERRLINLSEISASKSKDNNPPAMALDHKLKTKWVSSSSNPWFKVKFSSEEVIESITIKTSGKGEDIKVEGEFWDSGFLAAPGKISKNGETYVYTFNRPIVVDKLKIKGISSISELIVLGY